MLRDRTGYLLRLFAASAAFWWFFEFFNRFVRNWFYAGSVAFSPGEYFVYATLSFSTVLPAVLGTTEWLASFPRLTSTLQGAWRMPVARSRALAWATLLLASVGLLGLGIWPQVLFPFLWVAPLVIVLSLQTLLGDRTLLSPLRKGDWRPFGLPALAALLCGFFWEMWNYYSATKWGYAVPYVHRFLLFEMPLLGYAGYLPFGLECAVVADFLLGSRHPESARVYNAGGLSFREKN